MRVGVDYTDREDFSALVPRAQQSLGLGAGGVDGSVDGAPSIRRILGGLASIAQGIDELRNAEGGGHGRPRSPRLGVRHARLAFNGARTWCEIALETLSDPAAPWRSRPS
ncbi:abortive infection family protein [Microbacterium sp.]|uniref:abortive infection family protein n=1 Tax=Microbacterium sp. TaxID=51671 RepID=UPI00338E491A